MQVAQAVHALTQLSDSGPHPMLQHDAEWDRLGLAVFDHHGRGLESSLDGFFHQDRLGGFHQRVDRIDSGVWRRCQDSKINVRVRGDVVDAVGLLDAKIGVFGQKRLPTVF